MYAVFSLATPEEVHELNNVEYFVVGRELAGGRHYSQIVTWEDALKIYDEYVYFVNKMGGGTVDIYEKRYGDCESVKSTVVMDL